MDQEGRYPSATPGEDFAADGMGRPLDGDLRLLALAAILAHHGISASPGNLQCISFWDEAISGLIGCEVESSGFSATADGPVSTAVSDRVGRCRDDGRLTRSPHHDADLNPAMHPSEDAFARGHSVRGDGTGTEWWQAMHGFVWGFRATEDGGPVVKPGRDSADIRAMVLCDPIFSEGSWEGDGPSSVSIDMGKVSPDLEGRSGSVLAAVVAAMTAARAASGLAAPEPGQSGYAYARYLCGRASEGDPMFGESHLDVLRGRLCVDEIPAEDGSVLARFLDADEEVATLSYVPGERVVSLHVAPAHRRRGIGTLALRQAMGSGARAAPAAPACATGLLGRHGHRLADGSYSLVETRWVPIRPLPAPEGDRS